MSDDSADIDFSGPWRRNSLRTVITVLISTQVLDMLCYLINLPPGVHSVYFCWLCIVSVMTAFVGLSIARSLHKRLRIWAGASPRLFRKVLFSASMVSCCSIIYLVMAIWYVMSARWYATPCFAHMCLGRIVEVLYTGASRRGERCTMSTLLVLGDVISLWIAAAEVFYHSSNAFCSVHE